MDLGATSVSRGFPARRQSTGVVRPFRGPATAGRKQSRFEGSLSTSGIDPPGVAGAATVRDHLDREAVDALEKDAVVRAGDGTVALPAGHGIMSAKAWRQNRHMVICPPRRRRADGAGGVMRDLYVRPPRSCPVGGDRHEGCRAGNTRSRRSRRHAPRHRWARALPVDPGEIRAARDSLTARGEETDRIVGLELGADDYVTKPFSPRELAVA